MTNQSPIAPPPQLVEKWSNLPLPTQDIIAIAWRHGADQELEACIAWFDKHIPGYELVADRLRAARRPKLLSLKEQALKDINEILKAPSSALRSDFDRIIEAIKQLPDNE